MLRKLHLIRAHKKLFRASINHVDANVSKMTTLLHKPYFLKVSTKVKNTQKSVHVVYGWPLDPLPIYYKGKRTSGKNSRHEKLIFWFERTWPAAIHTSSLTF